MKKTIFKIAFVAGAFLLSINLNSSATTSSRETEIGGDDGGGFVCPTGDKFKCAEKNGWTVFKGDGNVVL